MRCWRISLILIYLVALAVPAGAQEPVRPVPGPPQSKTLNALHVSFVALETLDVYTTIRALNAGAVEANPLMRATAAHPIGMAAVKAGAAASTILLTRHLARDHRVAAILMAATLDSAYVAVAAHNLRVRRR